MTPARDSQPPRVCLVTPRFAPYVGGVETHVEQLARQLAAAGGVVEVLTQATRQIIEDAGAVQRRDGFVVRRCALPPGGPTDVAWPGLIGALRRVDADVVHAHNYHALPAAAAMMAARAGRLVLTPHYHGVGSTSLATAAHKLYRPALGRPAVRRAGALIAVSPSEKSLLSRDFGAAVGERTVVVPNGARAVPGRDQSTVETGVVLFVGRLDGYKRVDVLIRAMTLLPDPFRLVVVGDGPDRSRLRALAETLPVAGRVTFTGRVDQAALDDWMRRAEVFATASAIEAFGVTLADALASGLPAVASDIGAHRDVLAMAFGSASGPGFGDEPADQPEDVSLVAGTAERGYAAAITAVAGAARRGSRAPGLPSWAEVADRTMDVYRGMRADRLAGAGSW